MGRRTQYSFGKRQRELKRKEKAEKKRLRRQGAPEGDGSDAPDGGSPEGSEPEAPDANPEGDSGGESPELSA